MRMTTKWCITVELKEKETEKSFLSQRVESKMRQRLMCITVLTNENKQNKEKKTTLLDTVYNS